MKCPCKDCITFPMCLAISNEKSITWIAHLSNKCYLINDFIEWSLLKFNGNTGKAYDVLFRIFKKD